MGFTKFSDAEIKVLQNIIGSVETGKQTYGKRDYACYITSGTNTSNEKALTIGAYQNYGPEAKELLSLIRKTDPNMFNKLDTAGIYTDMVKYSWNNYSPALNSAKCKCIKAIISSPTGKVCQDQMFNSKMNAYGVFAYNHGVTNHEAIAECCNFIWQGGYNACTRILRKTTKPYTLEKLYKSTLTDTGNQVGAYKNRQKIVYTFLLKYWPKQSSSSASSNIVVNGNNLSNGGKAMISNSGHDERGRYSGGKAGDQYGNEWAVIGWYNRPWLCVLRHPDPKVREMIAVLAEEAAANNLIGYDQGQRYTYWEHLKASNYRPSQITIACEADCSAGVAANVKAVGYLMNIQALKNVSIYCYTGNMRQALKNAGFQVLTESKYLTGPNYLLRGDILLNDSHHVATNLTNGSKSGASSTSSTSRIANGNGSMSQKVQYNLYAKRNGIALRVWGGTSEKQLVSYPTVNKNAVLGYCDSIKDKSSHDWYYVQINGSKGVKYGFVDSNDVQKTKVEDPKPVVKPTTKPASANGKIATVNGNPAISVSNGNSFNKTTKFKAKIVTQSRGSLNFRTWADPNSAQLKSIPSIKYGQVVEVLDAIYGADKDLWYYVKYKGKYGFVSGKYLVHC